DITNLGHKDDIVKVRDGYGRNLLIPKGMAVLATPSVKKMHQENLRQRSHKELKLREDAEAIAKNLATVNIKVGAKTSSTGKIFGSVNTIQIAEVLQSMGYDIDRKNITLQEEAIKEIGAYKAVVKVYKDIKAEISFEVFSE
ncbi:MAG: 50S ribosomal protein L9, partial [Bacteroidales bacterium]|nr:50S ribosomal protein L9 [Bacteroidales bacterium]